MKKHIVLGVVLIVGAIGVLGFERVRSTFAGLQKSAQSTFDESKTDAQLAAEAQAGIERLDSEIKAQAGRIGVFTADRARLQRKVDEETDQLKAARSTLLRAQQLLKKGVSPVVVEGVSYSLEQVDLDATNRARIYQCLQQQHDLDQRALDGMTAALADARQGLADGSAKRTEMAAQLTTDQNRLANVAMLKQIDSLAKALRGTGFSTDSSLATAMAELSHRAEQGEAEHAWEAPTPANPVVRYEKPATGLAAIDKILGENASESVAENPKD